MSRRNCPRPDSCVGGKRGVCPACTPNLASIGARISAGKLGVARFKVPGWVVRAGLAEDFIDTAVTSDEFDAARHCRRLKAEAERAYA